MAVKQYVGARYVPKFDGAWNNSKSYEPLTVVTYGGSSYTSKKAAPAGVIPTNAEYWALTGNDNAYIEELRQDVLAVDARATGKVPTFVLIGDSFGEAANGWMEKLRGIFSGSTFYKSAVGGSGFCAPTKFVDQLNNLAVAAPDKVTHVIAIGGTNDTSTAYYQSAAQEVTNFVNAAKIKCPNAKIMIGYTATLCRAEDVTSYRRMFIGTLKKAYMDGCISAGGVFIDNLTEALGSTMTRISDDKIHPTEEGYKAISDIIANAVRGLAASLPPDEQYNAVTVTKNGFSTQVRLCQNAVLEIVHKVLYSGAAKSFPDGTWQVLADLTDLPFVPSYPKRLCVPFKATVSGSAKTVHLTVDISADGLRIANFSGDTINNLTALELLGDSQVQLYNYQ